MKSKTRMFSFILIGYALLSIVVIGLLLWIAYSFVSKGRAQEIPAIESPFGKDQEVTLTLLRVKLNDEESEVHKFFANKVEEALKVFKIPKITIDVTVYEDKERPAILVQRFSLPKFQSDIVPHVIKLKRHGLQLDDVTLEHMAYHEVARIRNIPLDTLPGIEEVDESERERRAEIEVYRTIGEEKYMVYWKSKRNNDRILRRSQSEEEYLREIKLWLGVMKYED